MTPHRYNYRKNICPENSVKIFFDEKIFGRKIFSQLGKKKFRKQKSASLEDALQIIKASRGLLNFGGLIFAISGAIGWSFF